MSLAKAIISAVVALTGHSSQAAEPAYREGQVWEYLTRSGDEGSLLKIQKIEPFPGNDKRVYHISIVGVELGPDAWAGVIQHAPVSKETLDASVTRLSDSSADFGNVNEGIAEWRRAEGGIFTIPGGRACRPGRRYRDQRRASAGLTARFGGSFCWRVIPVTRPNAACVANLGQRQQGEAG